MANLNIRVVNALPGTLEAQTMYMVKSATAGMFDIVMSTKDGLSTRSTITEAQVDSKIAAAVAALKTVEVVADIAARDALSPTNPILAFVTDASADTTVTAGAASYIWDGTAWQKVNEFESLDLILDWANIQNGPTASAEDIDLAVNVSHDHENMDVIELLGDTDGRLTYNGQIIGGSSVDASDPEW